MKFEMKRKIDNLGRIVLPIDLRNYYDISQGDTLVILPVKNGIHLSKPEYLTINELTDATITTIDVLGRFIVPSVFRNRYQFKPNDILRIVPDETCILISKEI